MKSDCDFYHAKFTEDALEMTLVSHCRGLLSRLVPGVNTCSLLGYGINTSTCQYQVSRMVRYLAQEEAVNVDLELFDSYNFSVIQVYHWSIQFSPVL